LIASANPLFREGLRKGYLSRWGKDVELVGTPATMDETLAALDSLRPDLVIVDYDDRSMNQAQFLSGFVAGQSTMKVVLVSLDEAGKVVIYDRRQLSQDQAERWLNDPWGEEDLFEQHLSRTRDLTERRRSMRHFIINAILVVVATLLVYAAIDAANVLPVAAATQATTIDWLFDLQWKAMSFLFSLIVVPLAYSLVVFRRRREIRRMLRTWRNTTLEISWTVLPLIAVVGLAYIRHFARGYCASTRRRWRPGSRDSSGPGNSVTRRTPTSRRTRSTCPSTNRSRCG
jgi:L-lactate permease